MGSLDDGNKSRIISYRDQEKGQIPSRIMVRLTGNKPAGFLDLGYDSIKAHSRSAAASQEKEGEDEC